MSRIIVKNLPKSVTEARLKELFSQKGIVTDVQLKYTKDGKFRRFCFIGFKAEEQAQAALNYFDKTCIDTSRISVDMCASLGDTSKPKSWSKYALDSTTHKLSNEKEVPSNEIQEHEKKTKSKKKKEVGNEVIDALEKHKDDPLFTEFLESHAAGAAKQVWSNDTIANIKDFGNTEEEINENEKDSENEDDSSVKPDNEKKSDVKVAVQKVSDLEYMKSLKKGSQSAKKTDSTTEGTKNAHGPREFFTVKVTGLGYNQKKKDIKQFFHSLKPKSIRVPQKIKGIAFVGFETEKQMKQALNKHKSFLAGKRLFVTKYEKKENPQNATMPEKKIHNHKWKQQEEALEKEESIAESGKMFIRNLAYTTTEQDIRALFEKYGPLSEVNLPIDKVTRKPKGFGTVTFLMPEHAVKAYSELDGSILNGRMLHILRGKGKDTKGELADQEHLSYKEKKELQKKATAGSSHNWNTLFLGQNAVAETIATTYNTTKEKVLEDTGNGTSVAVRLALGETQLVQDARKFLEENGVRLDAFNRPAEKRSGTVILAKNLPAQTNVREVREIFTRHGELGRVVMPPSGITALIEFLEPSEARKAFSKLAYTKFKHLPLYLEWAPDNTFTTAPSESNKNMTNADNSKVSSQVKPVHTVKENSDEGFKKEEQSEVNTNIRQQVEDEEEDEEEDQPEPDTTLFVKNLNFCTTESSLKEYFSKCGKLHYVTVATKKDPNNPGQKLSMGYGFVRYKTKMGADRALKELQMTSLDGKTLELKRSERTLQTDVVTAKKSAKIAAQTGTKILVRNIPFQAHANEVEELFKAFGEIKAVRLPKKLVGVEKHKGFAFVEYYTKSDAKRAFKALCQSTHLYGRRLVLEWAQAEEGVDEIRKRTAKHFHQEGPDNRSKKAMLDPESVGLDAE
ncbi:probable RNA-binding protein 19 [Cephus cinctus]|uniref:Probable RNA-binding protein 19 n=1 Tax=Cephus cinctus TaxID=211228 RepID=A0AAJ7FIF5_CEPCN|nr:probable RNA-binding protein 19 [Cephus cinctus]